MLIVSFLPIKNNKTEMNTGGPQIVELSDVDYKTMLGTFKEIKDRHKIGGNRSYTFP